MRAIRAGERLGTWALSRPIGSGGYGEVWEAHDDRGHRVAIKFLRVHNADALRRFDSEAQTLANLRAPNCVRYLSSGRIPDGTPYLVTEFVDGLTLSKWLKTNPTEAARMSVASQITTALAEVHRGGVLHRDLKPDNVMVLDDGGEPRIVMLDFGIARVAGRVDQDITKTGDVLGTPGFMSPEQIRGSKSVGPKSDCYSLGCMLFELFSGHPPFVGETSIAVCMKHLKDPPPEMTSGPPVVRQLVSRLLSKDQDARPTSAAAAAALEGGPPPQHERSRSLSNGTLALILAAVVAGIVLALLVVTRPDDRPPIVVEQRPPAALFKTGQPAVPAKSSAPATPKPAEVAPAYATGCADLPDLEPGVYDFGALVSLPEGYDRTERLPVIVVFHDGYTDPDALLKNFDPSLTDSPHRYIVIAPTGDPITQVSDHWNRQRTDRAFDRVASILETTCSDPARVLTLGHGLGGGPAIRYACEKEVRALATFGHRTKMVGKRVADECKPEVPRISLFPLSDPISPIDGSPGCTTSRRQPVDEAIEELFEGCGKRKSTKRDGAACETASCPEQVKLCRLEGDRRWPSGPGYDNRVMAFSRLFRPCDFTSSPQIDVTAEVVEFFDAAIASPAAEDDPSR